MFARQITTQFVNNLRRTDERHLPFTADTQGQENGIINLYPQRLYQKIYGFGGAFTDSAGYVFSLMPEELRRQFLCDCFSEKGLCYTWGRCPVDSCDFSLECYAADDDPTDETLAHFSLDRPLRYSLPLIREAGQVAGRSIQLMLTPWSPPAYMKTNGSRIGGGRLRPEYAERWARYLCRYILALRELGLDVRLLSVQNEAKAAQTWDSCLYTAREEREFIEHYLAPQLSRAHLDDICLLIWDHNKERAYERMSETLQSDAVRERVGGIAVHWYSGDHFEALQMIREEFPDKRMVFSEACIEYLHVKDQGQLRNARMYAHEMIGDFNAGVDTFLDWNLLLDERGGPNHVGNYCDAPILYDTRDGRLIHNLSYDYIGHFSRYIRPGAQRIGFSRCDGQAELTTFRNPTGELCVVALNPGSKDLSYCLRLQEQLCPFQLPSNAISTLVIE